MPPSREAGCRKSPIAFRFGPLPLPPHTKNLPHPDGCGRFPKRAPEGIRTPNLLIRSQMLYPLSYRRMFLASDFFNPSRQQVLLYGCPWMCASRKTRNLPKIPSVGIESTPFYRMIPGFLCSQNFFKIFLLRPKTFSRTAPNTCFDPAGLPKNPSKIFSR